MTEEKFKCENCNEAEFETEQQLRGHHMKCRPKTNTRDESKKERVPFGIPEQKWTTPSDDGFHYRVFNDNWRKEPGRVQRALNAGYEVVENVQSNTSVGTNDDGSEIRGVLMRIPDEFYKEDQAKKHRKLDETDKQIMGKGKMTNTYGDVKVETKINT